MNITKKILVLYWLFLAVQPLGAQTIVQDKKHQNWSKILQEVQITSQAIMGNVTLFVEKIQATQEFMTKAATIINGVVKNMQLIRKTIEIEKEIATLVNQSIQIIDNPDEEIDFLDKWKHIQLLLAIASQASNVFDLVKNIIQQDATIMDDKGRLTLIRQAYQEALKIKSAILTQLRRINREVYQYRRLQREWEIYNQFFMIDG